MLNGAERAAHSSWVQYGMELGIAGLVLFVMLCVGLVKGLRHLRKKAVALRDRHPAAKDEEVLAGHMLAVLAGVLVTGSFLSNAYYPMMYMALGMAGATLLGSPLADVPAVTPTSPDTLGHPRARRRLRNFPGQAPAG
jgi:O-antigen ligase